MKTPRNVNGSVPANSPTYNEMYPMGSPERAAMDAKIESVTGLDNMTIATRFDNEMIALRKAEADAKAEAKKAAIASAAARLDASKK